MKTSIKFFAVMMAGLLLFSACTKSDIKGFKKTKSGLHYRFETTNKSGEKVQIGDAVVGEITLKLDDKEYFSNVGRPGRIFKVFDSIYNGRDIDEGLLMMRTGEKATFAIFADTLAKFISPEQMPAEYQKNKGQIFYYEVSVADIVTSDELEQEEDAFQHNMEQRKEEESAKLAQYIADNDIKVAPTADGIYIIVKKMGKGEKVAVGKEVSMNYTGQLLDGKVFDSSVESVGTSNGLRRNKYEPLTYTVGKGVSLISGWEKGINGMPAGTSLRLIFPSNLGYGPQGTPDGTIPPFESLIFDIDILSVK